MNQEKIENCKDRILARDIAQEIDIKDLDNISGGGCRTETKVSYRDGKPDAELVLIC